MNWTAIFDKLIIPAAITVGTYVWSQVTKKRDDKKDNHSALDNIVENLVYELLDVYPLNVPVETYLKNSRGYIEERVWKVAEKRGIPRNATTEKLFHLAIERGTAILAREITNLRNYNEKLRSERPTQ